MSRRTKGAGTVFRKGNKWVAQIDLGMSPDGKRMRRTRIASTRRDAEKLLRALLNDRDLGLAKTNENPTLKEIWAEWYEIGSQTVKPATADQYLWRLEHWVSKRLVANHVRDVTPTMLMTELRRLHDSCGAHWAGSGQPDDRCAGAEGNSFEACIVGESERRTSETPVANSNEPPRV